MMELGLGKLRPLHALQLGPWDSDLRQECHVFCRLLHKCYTKKSTLRLYLYYIGSHCHY